MIGVVVLREESLKGLRTSERQRQMPKVAPTNPKSERSLDVGIVDCFLTAHNIQLWSEFSLYMGGV